jgi:orotate phosphoribosyltransferase
MTSTGKLNNFVIFNLESSKMNPISSPSKNEIAELTARMLLDIKAVHFNSRKPFILASGLPSPTYIDCRKIISFPRVRSTLMDFLTSTVMKEVGFESFDNISGGETAGIPFSALIAERLALPLTYVRKKPKGYGRNTQIEGVMGETDRVLLVEDMTTDGGSKIDFVNAIRDTGATCNNTAVIFYYDIFPETLSRLKDHNITLHYLCTWWDVLSEAKKRNDFDNETLSEVEKFLKEPRKWQAEYSSIK